MLYSRNYHNIVDQLYVIKLFKILQKIKIKNKLKIHTNFKKYCFILEINLSWATLETLKILEFFLKGVTFGFGVIFL